MNKPTFACYVGLAPAFLLLVMGCSRSSKQGGGSYGPGTEDERSSTKQAKTPLTHSGSFGSDFPRSSIRNPSSGDPHPPVKEPVWVDASKQAWTNGIVQVKITGAKIDFPTLVDLSYRLERKEDFASDEKTLLILFSIENVSDDRKIDFSSWGYGGSRLTDNLGNKYKRSHFANASVKGHAREMSLYPGKSASDLISFEVPVAKAQYLRLELDGEQIGSKEPVYIQIPTSMLKK